MSRSKSNPKIVISGYYGYDNCGDEAVLMSIIHCLRTLRPDVKITVLSGNPEKTRAVYGVDAVNRWNLVAIKIALLRAHLLISGGGSLIQDVTSVRSPSYYLGIIRLALLMQKKVIIYSQGVGPIITQKNREKTSKVFNRCHAITLRDEGSAALLSEIGVTKNLNVTCDPVLALNRDHVSPDLIHSLTCELGLNTQDGKKKAPLLFVSVRNWKDDRHFEPIAKFLDAQAANGWNILLVPAHFPQDVNASALLRQKMEAEAILIERCLSAHEFLALTAIADNVFSMRLHGLICAMAVGTPMVGLSYDPKVDAFMEKMGLSRFCLSFDDFNVQKAISMMDALHVETESGSSSYAHAMETHRQELHKLAWDTAKIANALL
ncbi:MAG: polysaccharide pyruvyl transferase CsaB [Oscillospiraceae bacterium]|nr:polysaccharide pyruvyl transferase CsaB [Oscillospiraceae bacterium]